MVTVMVIACSHALGLACCPWWWPFPRGWARHGLLISHRRAFEAEGNLQVVIFDKTGTLTEGRFGVTNTLVFPNGLS